MALTHSPQIVTSGLYLYLDAANTKSYPGTGTAWRDLSGNQNAGTLVNGPVYSTANSGRFTFDGVNDYVSFSTVNVSTSALTVSAWVYDNDTVGDYRDIVTKAGQFKFRINNNAEGGGLSAFVWIGGAAEPRITTTWTKNVWTNVAFCWNTSGTFRLFINGVVQTSSTTRSGTLDSAGSLFVGCDQQAVLWNGFISGAMIYNQTLTDDQILQNFNALRGRYGV